ncbi:lytic transglycosylase domain-containing protein [Clostridium polynesiense]|uniref:lytic transglycosylase domain-containing protein n=1 Tax=Clostridium polynesiense TaxID=1325933 RepID=UPI000694420D|nr:lytic transglycosylase domain-containing protein [Clostridium polynesiense]
MKKFVSIIIVALVIILIPYILYNGVYPYKYKEQINKYSEQNNLDPLLVLSVIKAESNFKPNALSNKGAYGLMQITENTGKDVAEELKINDFTAESLFEPEWNIRFGTWYLNSLIKEFKNIEVALAAYNGGMGNVKKWLKNSEYSEDGKTLKYIPFPETDKYVKRIRVNYNIYVFLYRKLPSYIPFKNIIKK